MNRKIHGLMIALLSAFMMMSVVAPVRAEGDTSGEEEWSPFSSELWGSGESQDDMPLKKLEAESDNYKVVVAFDEETAGLPEKVSAKVKEFEEDSDEYKEAKEAVTETKEAEPEGFAAFDITLYDENENPVEPQGTVKVSVEVNNLPADAEGLEVQHLTKSEDEEEGKLVVEVVAVQEESEEVEGTIEVSETQATALFNVDGFSTFALTWSKAAIPAALADEPAVEPMAEEDPPVVLLDAEEDLPDKPDAKKELHDNNDGTSTLSLSVKGAGVTDEDTKVVKSNVVIVLDRSSSMNFETTYTFDPETTYDSQYHYYAQSASWGAVAGQSVNGPANNATRVYYNKTDHSWHQSSETGAVYTGRVLVTRLTAAQMAIKLLITELLSLNTQYGIDDLIEIKFLSFARYRTTGGQGTNSWLSTSGYQNSTFYNNASNANLDLTSWSGGSDVNAIMRHVNYTNTAHYTNWQDGFNYAQAQVSNGADGTENSFVIFMTDGDPTLGGDAYQASAHRSANIAAYSLIAGNSNVKSDLFSIFTFGSSTPSLDGRPSQDHLRETTYAAYNGTDSQGNIPSGADINQYNGKNFFDAQNADDLMNAFSDIISSIKSSVAFGNVSFIDGMSTDVTASTIVAGKADGFRYEVKDDKDQIKYTVEATGNSSDPDVIFHIDGQTYTQTSTPAVVKKTELIKTEDPADTGTEYEYYSVTIGTGADAKEYKMALAEMDDSGKLTWGLNGLGALENGWTYTVSFIVWPDQDAYDYVAGLNNGLKNYVWSGGTAVYDDNGTLLYYKGGAVGYPNIVKMPDGTFDVLSNTDQSITYSVVNTVEDEDGIRTTYTKPVTMPLVTPPPMGLDESEINIAKVWEHGLAEDELHDLIWDKNGEYTDYFVELTVFQGLKPDGTEYKTFTFPKLIEVTDETTGETKKVPVQADGVTPATPDYPATDLIWSEDFAMAPGIMVSEDEALSTGLIVKNAQDQIETTYKSVVIAMPTFNEDGTKKVDADGNPVLEDVTFYILPNSEGHDYYIEETDGSDLHFEYSSVVYHPMLLDNVLYNVEFTKDAEGNITGARLQDTDELETFEGVNTLRGGINIFKKVGKAEDFAEITTAEDGTKSVTLKDELTVNDSKDQFTFEVELWTEEEDGNKAVYTETKYLHKEGDKYIEDGTYGTIEAESGSVGYRIREGNTTVARGPVTTETLPEPETDPDAEPAEEEETDKLPAPTFEIGADKTKVTITMQANQEIRFVNLPIGTKYTVKEVEETGNDKIYNYLFTYGEVLKDNVKTYVGDTVNNDYSGSVHGNTAEVVTFYNWSDSNFYVYHSHNNKVEKIFFTDNRVTRKYDGTAYTYEFNIVDEVADEVRNGTPTGFKTLYGGYYKNYKYSDQTKAWTTAGAEYDENNWYQDPQNDTTVKPYVGERPVWDWEESYNTDEADPAGTKMNPVKNETYYLKEVPTYYLRPYTHYTYYLTNNQIANIWYMSNLDDSNYNDFGYKIAVIEPEASTDQPAIKAVGSLKITNKTETMTLRPADLYKQYGMEQTNAYLAYYKDPMDGTYYGLGRTLKIQQYWVTPDGITVYNPLVRTISVGNGKVGDEGGITFSDN